MAVSHRIKLQYSAMFFALLGSVLTCVSTFVPLWKNLNLDLNEMEYWNMGLWQTCVEQDAVECKSFDSFLALPFPLRMSRILMLLSNALGIIGLIVSFMCLDCLNIGEKDTKRKLALCGGTLFWASGITALIPVSWIAYDTVQEFWDETIPEIVPRWEFGDAMFICWFGCFFLVLGGSLLFSSMLCSAEQPYCKSVAKNTHKQLYQPASLSRRCPDLII